MRWDWLAQSMAFLGIGIIGWLLGLPVLRLVSSDVIAACSILAAFLIQLMLLIATVLTPGGLMPELFRQLSQELDKKQSEALTLFVIYTIAIGAFLAIKMTDTWTPHTSVGLYESRICALLAGAMLAFVVARTIHFLTTMRKIQQLRHRLLLQSMTVESLKASTSTNLTLQDHSPEDHSPPFGRSADY